MSDHQIRARNFKKKSFLNQKYAVCIQKHPKNMFKLMDNTPTKRSNAQHLVEYQKQFL